MITETETNIYTFSDHPFNRLFGKNRLSDSDKKQILILWIIAWLPPAILSFTEGTFFSGVTIPFIYDFSFHARILIAIFLFIYIKKPIDIGVNTVLTYVSISLLTKEESDKILTPAWKKAKKLNNSLVIEILIFLFIISFTILQVSGNLEMGLKSSLNTWIIPESAGFDNLSAAGYWYIFISKLLFLFLFLKWILKYILWVWLLRKVSKMNLSILPVHSDRSGGLGIFIIAQQRFSMLFFSIGTVFSGEFVTQLIYYNSIVSMVSMQIFAYVLLSLIILIFPLLFFTKKLIYKKMEGMIYYGHLASTISRKFNSEWLKGKQEKGEKDEHQIDPSILIDYTGNYEIVKNLKVIPMGLYDIIGMAGIIASVFIPVLFVQMSFEEILSKLLNILI